MKVEQLCSIEGFVASILKHVISRGLWFSYVFQEKRKETSLNVSHENQVADLKLNSLLAVINILVIIPYVCMLFVSSANRYPLSTTLMTSRHFGPRLTAHNSYFTIKKPIHHIIFRIFFLDQASSFVTGLTHLQTNYTLLECLIKIYIYAIKHLRMKKKFKTTISVSNLISSLSNHRSAVFWELLKFVNK